MKKKLGFILLIMVFLSLNHHQAQARNASIVLEKDHALHAQFLDFSFSRIQILNRNFMHNPDNIFVEPRDPFFVARYHKVEPASVTVEVKKTNSGMTPYIGVLRYTEIIYESNGGCSISVVEGPFSPVHYRKVTEIFRYVQNRWQ